MENREVSQLKVNPNNPRGQVVEDDSLRELAESIKAQGVLQAILITPDGTIVCGHRRVKACELAAVHTVPCVVRDLNEQQQLHVMLIENLQREDLTALQTAKAYRVLIDHGLSIREIAKATGFRAETISQHLDILTLHPDLHSAFDGDQCLALGCIRYLIDLQPDEQLRIGNLARTKGWTISRIARECATLEGGESKPIGNGTAPRGLDRTLLDRVYERIDNGCYTPEAISKCDECGCQVFPSLTVAEIKAYVDALVKEGRVRWTPQGGKKDNQRGSATMLCMPVVNDISSFSGAVNSFQRQPLPRKAG